MKTFHGIPVSSGIAIGPAHLYIEEDFTIPKYNISDISFEKTRLTKAIEQTRKELNDIKKALSNDETSKELYTALLSMLDDHIFWETVYKELETTKKNIEWVLYIILDEYISKFKQIPNKVLASRHRDLHELGHNIMKNLLKREKSSINKINEPSILIARNIPLTSAAIINKDKILGFVAELGGEASHMAIMAKALGIPAVLGIEFITSEVKEGDKVVVNGITGDVHINPDEATLRRCYALKEKFEKFENDLIKTIHNKSFTKDNIKISVYANLEIPEELEQINKFKAEGIGLYRSEFIIIKSNSFPPEEIQYREYKKIFKTIGYNKKVIIRTLDLGGDKVIPGYSAPSEKNPFLGWRAIRFCLANKDIFKEQLRAILRASYKAKDFGIMIPMIANLEEVVEAKKILKEVEKELEEKGVKFNKNYKFGVMIEIPSAVVMADEIAKKVDFFSIGTNDLIQYLLAVDRGNEKVAYLFKYLNPAVLKTIEQVITAAKKNNIEVSMCGEMAADIYSIPLLIGMGLRDFSVTPSFIPELKNIIKSISVKECESLYREIIECKYIDQIEAKVKSWINKKFPEFLIKDLSTES